MIPSQMLKGTLSGCILAIISREETYGYEIAEKLSGYGFGKIAEGTIYPLLLRLEKTDLSKPSTVRQSLAQSENTTALRSSAARSLRHLKTATMSLAMQ